MQITVIGANGGISRELFPRLADAGHGPVGVVRDESQFEAVRDRGDEPRLDDLEGDFEPAFDGADAIVFAANSGGSTDVDKTFMVSLQDAWRVVGVCVEADIDRFVVINSIDAGDPFSGPKALRPYLVAKCCADDYFEQSSLGATISHPIRLTDTEDTGSISLTAESLDGGTPEIPQTDVAQAVVASLDIDRTVGETLMFTGGNATTERAFREDD